MPLKNLEGMTSAVMSDLSNLTIPSVDPNPCSMVSILGATLKSGNYVNFSRPVLCFPELAFLNQTRKHHPRPVVGLGRAEQQDLDLLRSRVIIDRMKNFYIHSSGYSFHLSCHIETQMVITIYSQDQISPKTMRKTSLTSQTVIKDCTIQAVTRFSQASTSPIR